jgi:hypothetical protein
MLDVVKIRQGAKMCEYFAVRPVMGELKEKHPVFIVHWWPGREYKKFDELPKAFRRAVRRARGSDSKYLTFACTFVPGAGELHATSRCMSIDNPSRKYGRNRALGLLRQRLLENGYTLVAM